jgi:ferritin-like metal-binding protein YciE
MLVKPKPVHEVKVGTDNFSSAPEMTIARQAAGIVTAVRNERKTFMAKLNSLEVLLLHEVQDLYSAEKQLLKALPKVVKKISSPLLRSAVEEHLQQTEEHVDRLEQVFELLGADAKTRTCKGMKGLISEADEMISERASPAARDAAIIAAAQKVEHYEIATYGTARKWAETVGRNDIHRLLGQTLEEEEQTDQRLTELAASGINQKAAEHMGSEKQFVE